jgi:hypothetical protein
MAKLRIRASHVPEAWALPRFMHVVSFVEALLDVFTEARDMAHAAAKRYPLVEG